MKVSVITVAYNSASTLVDTLQSVSNQTYGSVEHILIDGGSTDGTIGIVKKDGRHLKRFVSEPDRGLYDAMNKGVSLATGDVIGFLNSDDIFETPRSLERIMQGFSDNCVDAVYGDIVMVDPIRLDVVRRYWRPGPHKVGACARGWMAPHPTLYVRRDVLLSSGGFNLEYKFQADFDLEVRLFECMKIRAKYIPETIVRMRMGGVSTGSPINVFRGNCEAARSVKNNGFIGGPIFILIKMVRRLNQYWQRP